MQSVAFLTCQIEGSDPDSMKALSSEIDELVFVAYGIEPGDIEKIKHSNWAHFPFYSVFLALAKRTLQRI